MTQEAGVSHGKPTIMHDLTDHLAVGEYNRNDCHFPVDAYRLQDVNSACVYVWSNSADDDPGTSEID